MGIESGNKIADLNSNWPLGSDPKSQGDDHIRLIKTVITNDVLSKDAGGTVKGATTVQNGLTVGPSGNFTLDRTGAGVAAYINAKGDAGSQRGLRISDDAGTLQNAVIMDTAGVLQLGDTDLPVIQLVASSTGRHNFYCGTGNLDAALDSDGFYLFGTTGLATTGKLTVNSSINTGTLAVTGGVQLGHGGTNAYLNNTEGGEIRFQWSGTTKAYVETNGYLFASSHQSGGVKFGRGSNHAYLDDVANTGNFYIQQGGTNRLTIKSVANGGEVIIERDGTNAAPALLIDGTYLTGIYNDSAGRFSISDDGTKVAQFEETGTALNANTSVVTREKGDARYHQLSEGEVILAAGKINASGSFEYKRGPVNMTVSSPGSGRFDVTFASTITDAVIQVSPANTSNTNARFCTITAYNDNGFSVAVKNPSNDYVADCGVFVTVM